MIVCKQKLNNENVQKAASRKIINKNNDKQGNENEHDNGDSQ